MKKQLWSPANIQSGPLSQCFSTYELWHLWGTHIRYPAYQLFTLRFITVAKLQLWSSNKITMVEGTTWGTLFEAEHLTEPKVLNWLETAWPASPGDSPNCLLVLGLEVCATQPTILHRFWRSEFTEPFPQSIKLPFFLFSQSILYIFPLKSLNFRSCPM